MIAAQPMLHQQRTLGRTAAVGALGFLLGLVPAQVARTQDTRVSDARTQAARSPAANGRWVEVERRVPLTEGRTADDVRQAALRDALAEAVRRVGGVRVQGTQQATLGDSAGQRIDRYVEAVRIDAVGRATRWETVHEEWRTTRTAGGAGGTGGASQPVYVLTLRVEVTPELGRADPGFAVSLSARSTQLTVRGGAVADNDEMVAVVSATRESYLTLVSVVDDSVFVLVPNALMTAVVAGPAGPVELPDAAMRRLGLHFRVTLPPTVRGRTEGLVVVATTKPVTPPGNPGAGESRDTGTLTLSAFNQWLVGIPLEERTLAELPIQVRRSP